MSRREPATHPCESTAVGLVDSQGALKFSVRAGVQSMNEVYLLERVTEACERMMSGKAEFRGVLTMESGHTAL